MMESVVDDFGKLLWIDGLGQMEVESRGFGEGPIECRSPRCQSNKDDPWGLLHAPELARCLVAVHDRHVDIQDHKIGLPMLGKLDGL